MKRFHVHVSVENLVTMWTHRLLLRFDESAAVVVPHGLDIYARRSAMWPIVSFASDILDSVP